MKRIFRLEMLALASLVCIAGSAGIAAEAGRLGESRSVAAASKLGDLSSFRIIVVDTKAG